MGAFEMKLMDQALTVTVRFLRSSLGASTALGAETPQSVGASPEGSSPSALCLRLSTCDISPEEA